jgi:hypothetical protein
MFAILHALGMFVADLFKSRSRLEAENLFRRHQLNIALWRAPVCTENSIRIDWGGITQRRLEVWPNVILKPLALLGGVRVVASLAKSLGAE